MTKKVVVVGSGFGGLASALRLRAKGYDVTLLEKHSDLGGRARVFKKDGFIYDGGPTVITAPYLFEELFSLFNKKISNYVKIVPLNLWYRFIFNDGKTFDYSGDAKSMEKEIKKFSNEYFKGYNEDPDRILDKTFGDVDGYDDMVVQKNISVQSHCEHHMAPIIGKAHVAYIPKDRVVGLSKLARVVEVFSKRLQTQERLTMQIANTLMKSLDAKGVAVTIDSTHQCMTMRGIKKEQATTVTNYYLGQFKEYLSYQNRYLRFISISKY